MNFEGENISLKDALFVDNITGDIESFRIRSSSIARVLVFPPVSNYHRFLIHKVVETGFPQFTTFSVGEGIHRRTVVCFQLHLVNFTLEQAGGGTKSSSEIPPDPTSSPAQADFAKSSAQLVGDLLTEVIDSLSCEINQVADPSLSGSLVNTSISPSAQTCDRVGDSNCDTTINNNSTTTGDLITASERNKITEHPSPAIVELPAEVENSVSDTSSTCDKENLDKMTADQNLTEKGDGGGDSAGKRRPRRPAQAVYVPPRGRAGALQESPTKAKVKSVKKSPKMKDPKDMVSRIEEKENDNVLDVTEQIVTEITAAVGGVQIEEPEIDYLSFQTSDSSINIDQFGHVIELYDFPSSYKTADLVNAFQAFTSRWDIKWVDDTHALGVFSSSETAAEALAVRHPNIMTRPLNMATPQSKIKARAVFDELLPYKPRPVSCTGPARRLLQRALGSTMRVPEASKVENDRLLEAQRKKEENRRRGSVEEERRKRREVEERGRGDKKYKFGQHDDR